MKRSNPWITAALQSILLLSTVALASPWLEAREASLPTPRRPLDVALAANAARPIYNRAVVPGGVYSADELRRAMQRDPVVASHYRGAAVAELRPVLLTAGRAAYVSYRVNDKVYWTRQRVWLRAGETVLTDGTTVVRARCGNCVSDAQLGPVAAVDPAHGELDDFVVPPLGDGAVDEAAPELADLLELPFGPQVFVAASPAIPTFVGDDGEPFHGFPLFGARPLFVPVGTGGGDVPPVPSVVFLPPDGTTSGSTSGTTDTTGGTDTTTGTSASVGDGPGGGATTSTSGTSGGTTGTPGDTTSTGGTTPGTTGAPGFHQTGSTPTDGAPTTESPFPTTSAITTVSTSPNPRDAPEPGLLWLVTCGAIGVASRRWRR